MRHKNSRSKKGGMSLLKNDKTRQGGKMPNAKELLGELKKIDGVKAILVVGRDGFCVESLVAKDMDIEALSALFSTSVGPYEVMGNDLKMGDLKQNMIEFNSGNIILTALDANAILGVVTDIDTNLGAIRYNIKKISKDLVKTL